MIFLAIILIGLGMFAVERLWPANGLPRVRNWWGRVALVNLLQGAVVVLAGVTWDRWIQSSTLLALDSRLGLAWQVGIAYLTITFVYYFWHRLRHESKFFWRLCHQLHHSPRRLEIVTSFYKHPVELLLNSLLTGSVVYLVLGISPAAAGLTTLATAVAEFFYHWNVSTPRWFGYLFQRPESHRVHHMRHYHTNNYGDLPVWDIMFGTFQNPHRPVPNCGFGAEQEDRFDDIIAFRDVNDEETLQSSPLHLLPTCIGCSKRWACAEARGKLKRVGDAENRNRPQPGAQAHAQAQAQAQAQARPGSHPRAKVAV